MKKILYCASTAGHLRAFHLPYLNELVRRGHSVTTAALGSGEGLPAEVTHIDVPFTQSFSSPNNFKAAITLTRLIRRERFDVILTHTTLAAFFTRLALLLAGRRGARVVNTVHGYLFTESTPFPPKTVLLAAEKLVARVTDDILTMNRQDTEIAQKHRLCRGDIRQVDGMGLDTARFRPAGPQERADARRMLGIPQDAFVMLCAAEFSKGKDQRFLLENLAALPEDCFLLLPGRGALLDDCRAAAAALGISDRVLLPGFATDIRPYLQAADLCVSASRKEGLPFHVMEAMCRGLPSILTCVKGHEDLMEDGKTGFLFPLGDGPAFRAAAERLHDDPSLRARMGESAVRAAARYDIQNVFPIIMRYYD